MMMRSISGFTMKSLFPVLRTQQGKSKSSPFSVLSCSAIHTSNEPILRHSDLDYAFGCIENVDEAVSLFHYMLQMKPIPSIYDYHKLFNVVVKIEHYTQVILMFKELRLLGCGVYEYFMNTLINCYANLEEVELGFPIVAHFLKQGYPPDIVAFNCFIKGFFLKGNVAEALGLFRKLVKNEPCEITEITITTVLDGLSKSGSILDSVDEAVTLFRCMLQMIPIPSIWDFHKLFKVVVRMEHYTQVVLMFKELRVLGCGVNEFIMNTLINCYAHLKKVELSFPVVGHFLKQGYHPDIWSFNCFIKGFFLKGNVAEAVGLFSNLVKNKSDIDEITIATVLDGLWKSGNIVDAVDLLLISEKNDWKLDVFCYSIVLDGLWKSRMLKDGMELLNRMSDRGILPDVVTYTIFLHGLCTHDKLDLARSIFNDLPSKKIAPNVRTYNVMINGFCHQGLFLEARDMLVSMERLGCFPDSFTYNIIVRGCLQLHHRHNIYSIDLLLRRIVGRDFQLAASTFFLLLGQVEVLRQMHTICNEDVFKQLILKLIFSCLRRQLRDKDDESIIRSLIQKLIQR